MSEVDPRGYAPDHKLDFTMRVVVGKVVGEYEREFVLRKLEENRWNMTKAAQALGLERSHLYRKMRTLGIAPARE